MFSMNHQVPAGPPPEDSVQRLVCGLVPLKSALQTFEVPNPFGRSAAGKGGLRALQPRPARAPSRAKRRVADAVRVLRRRAAGRRSRRCALRGPGGAELTHGLEPVAGEGAEVANSMQ